ncbi:MAG: altronate dehydrogenase [Verrucomicrobiae bacterium]|nr:altronate dehydrogenase [Verrucomicrobiae bacterium]
MILQFGAGNFLRAFADLFIDEMSRDPDMIVGRVRVVQSTGRDRAEALNRAGGRYHVAIQGYETGQIVDKTVEVASIECAWHAGDDWDAILDTAADPGLRVILSNTTEAGLALDDADDRPGPAAPVSFPAKLLALLRHRHRAGLPGPWIVPCELIEANGAVLKGLVRRQAERWGVPADTLDWLENDCRWVNTLVDRIVPGPPGEHPLLGVDPLLVSAEPFAFWAVESAAPDAFPFRHPAILTAPDIAPYTLRKVRLLNAAHSALVCKAPAFGVETVREGVEHPVLGEWLEGLLFEEIVPVLEGRCDDPAGFARAVLDRFRNPFLEHRLSSIALNHEAKIAVRLKPALSEYRSQFGADPPRLAEILA